MTKDSYLKSTLDSAKDKAKYDENVKYILSDKYILSWILKHSTSEFRKYTIEEIYQCIQGIPVIGEIGVMPGSTHLDKVLGLNSESTIPNEGKITFDVLFLVRHPESQECLPIFINIEAQKDAHPGYDLGPRGIFYCARMISSQMDVVMSTNDYAVKKVYSIFISMEEGKYANTIRSYEITPKDLYGTYRDPERYDLLSVVMIRLPKNEDASFGNELHKLLTTALSSQMTPEEKEDILEHTYGIPMTYELKEATTKMCNLSDLVEERGIQKGIEINLVRLVIKKLAKSYTVSEMADQLEESEIRIQQIVDIVKKHAPEYDERKILAELLEKDRKKIS